MLYVSLTVITLSMSFNKSNIVSPHKSNIVYAHLIRVMLSNVYDYKFFEESSSGFDFFFNFRREDQFRV